jgi:hypothetical protein
LAPNATLKPANEGVSDRATSTRPPASAADASGHESPKSFCFVCALQKPGALSDGTIAHVPLKTPTPPAMPKVATDWPPMTGSLSSCHSCAARPKFSSVIFPPSRSAAGLAAAPTASRSSAAFRAIVG